MCACGTEREIGGEIHSGVFKFETYGSCGGQEGSHQSAGAQEKV